MRLNKLLGAFALAATTTPALAQVVSALPYQRTMDLLVTDVTYDGIWRLADLNQDGDYNDAGEITSYYSDVIGSFSWDSPGALATSSDGTVFVGDVGTDQIYALRDDNGNGTANDPGEHRIFYDSTLPGALVMQQVRGLTVDASGRVFAAVSNQSPLTTADRILKFEDVNGDGDAQDVGEASVYHSVPLSTGNGNIANSIPTRVTAGPDASLYYTDVGTLAGQPGIWKLSDLNFDGDTEDAGEASLYWNPSPGTNQYWSLEFDQNGAVYTTDHGVGTKEMWRAFDTNGDGTIQVPGEQTLFYSLGNAVWWDLVVRDDGALLLVDSDPTNDIITLFRDLDNDGSATGLGEAVEVYNAGSASQVMRVASLAILRGPTLEMVPPVASIGTTVNFQIKTGKPFELAAPLVAISQIPPFSLAPFGNLEIDPVSLLILGFGLSDAQGNFTFPVTVPNNPVFINTYGTQALCGDGFRLFLSNSALQTITP